MSHLHVEQETDINAAILSQNKELIDMETYRNDIRNEYQVLEERLTRAENEIANLEDELMMQEARSMRDNLKFFGIPESRNENCEQTVKSFIKDKLVISVDDMNKISFERIHRTGNTHQ